MLEERRKQGCDKSTSYKTLSSKHLRPQRHSQTHNLLSPIKTSPVIQQPLSVTALPAASLLNISPELFTHFSASTGQRLHAGAGRADRDGHDATLEREHEFGEMGNQEKGGVEEERDTSGIHTEPGQRTVKFQEDPQLRSEEVEETEGLHDIEKVVIGRKASKKHKSK